jgi:hypothetical protein
MDTQTTRSKEGGFACHNYCVSFIDLLGQRDAMRSQGLLPSDPTQLIATFRDSIRGIVNLQQEAETMLKPLVEATRPGCVEPDRRLRRLAVTHGLGSEMPTQYPTLLFKLRVPSPPSLT